MEYELREWRWEDAADIAALANNKKIAGNLRDLFPHPYTMEHARQYIEGCLYADPAFRLDRAVVVEGKAAGSIGVFRQSDVYRKSAEIGYWLGEPFWGRGIMTGAVGEICRLAFARLDIVRIYAEIFAYNAASRRVLEKAGFTLEGAFRSSIYKNGRIYDSLVLALVR